ncbi:MAG: hypothetical protein EZS28_040531, partial [Streblomastix strix]
MTTTECKYHLCAECCVSIDCTFHVKIPDDWKSDKVADIDSTVTAPAPIIVDPRAIKYTYSKPRNSLSKEQKKDQNVQQTPTSQRKGSIKDKES